MSKGILIVLSGSAGVGKGTIVDYILANDDNFRLSQSWTTRSPRPGEKIVKKYRFVTKEEFTEMIDKNGFLEYASYVGEYYGTPKEPVEQFMKEDYNVILEIDVQGGLQIMKLYPDCVSIFIAPPSIEELERRLVNRGTETKDKIARRMETAKKEKQYITEYQHSVVNDKVERAAEEIISIVNSERERRS